MKIDAFLTPYFPETESQFDDGIVVMIDVLRASTTVCAALSNGAKEIIPAESLEKAVKIYSGLDRESRFLGGERFGEKPEGFNAGNSPFEYNEEQVKGKTVIITTTNGTKTFQKAKQARLRLIGAFVNRAAVLEFISNELQQFLEEDKEPKITLLCAGTNGRLSYEDVLCAGLFIDSLCGRDSNCHTSDAANAARNLYISHKNNLKEFLYGREHAVFLKKKGFEKDIELSFTFDKFDVVPIMEGTSIKNRNLDK
jgi:2-phosphosulfolactate phosphatase